MEGIIYKVQSYLENDRLLFVYTPLGRKTLIAKGAQKLTSEQRTLSAYLTLIEFEDVSNKNMMVLKQSRQIESFSNIKKDFNMMEIASIMFDLLNQMVTENDQHDSIFQLLIDALKTFKREVMLSFGFKLLKHLGYQLQLKPDGRKVRGFSIARASLVYVGENEKIDLDLTLTTVLLKLTYSSYDTIEEIEDINFLKLKTFMYDYYEYHTDVKMIRK